MLLNNNEFMCTIITTIGKHASDTSQYAAVSLSQHTSQPSSVGKQMSWLKCNRLSSIHLSVQCKGGSELSVLVLVHQTRVMVGHPLPQ